MSYRIHAGINPLPAPEDAEFFVILRAYLPEPVLVEQQWIPPSLTNSPKG